MRIILLLLVVIVTSFGCGKQSVNNSSLEAAEGETTLPQAEPQAETEKESLTQPGNMQLLAQNQRQGGGRGGMKGKGMQGRGMQGRGMQGRGGPGGMGGGPGGMGGMRGDMMTLHALFAGRAKIKRTIKSLPNGAETLTESDDPNIVKLLHEHVPAMEGRVITNDPLPPMRFHPLFQELIKNSKKIKFDYDETKRGVKVTYTSKEPYVAMLIQEHAKLVSRFIKNGMQEIHKPYKIPKLEGRNNKAK